MRVLIVVLTLLCASPLAGQDAPVPIIETTLEKAEVVPGQAVTLRLTVLVPTWMPSPPDLPGFEAPNLRVRVPSKGTTATSRQVNGETWSGVSRRYLLTPMVPGEITLPPQEVQLTYAGMDGTTGVKAVLHTAEVSIRGIVPEGAEGLDPFVAAESLTLTQELSGPTTGLEPGASVIRKLTATMDGASPIALPALLAPLDLSGVEVYPALPQVTEDLAQTDISGTRVESQTLMAVGGGTNNIPPVRLDWFNLRTGKVETAEVPGFGITVTGPPLKPGAGGGAPDWKRVLLLAGALLAVGIAVWRILPRLKNLLATRQAIRLASEGHARRMLESAISRQDYAQTSYWLAAWMDRRPGLGQGDRRLLSDRMARIGGTIYRDPAVPRGDAMWRDLKAVLLAAASRTDRSGLDLPEINPRA